MPPAIIPFFPSRYCESFVLRLSKALSLLLFLGCMLWCDTIVKPRACMCVHGVRIAIVFYSVVFRQKGLIFVSVAGWNWNVHRKNRQMTTHILLLKTHKGLLCGRECVRVLNCTDALMCYILMCLIESLRNHPVFVDTLLFCSENYSAQLQCNDFIVDCVHV